MELASLLAKKREQATELVRATLASVSGTREMRGDELASYKHKIGWTTTRSIAGEDFELDLLLPRRFPYDPPEVWVRGKGETLSLTNSHVQRSGQLCLFPDSAAVNVDDSGAVALHCLQEAEKLIAASDTTGFTSEFSSHWSRASNDNAGLILIVDEPASLLNACYAETEGKLTFVGSTAESVQTWISNHLGGKVDLKNKTPCFVADIGGALTPTEYPATTRELHNILSQRHAAGARWLEEQVVSSKTHSTILLLQTSPSGPALAGVGIPAIRLGKNKSIRKGRPPGKRSTQEKFSDGKHLLDAKQVLRTRTRRVDHSWIHARGGDGRDLQDKSVCVIGCGSLGGYISHLIARSGVSQVTLVDSESLDWNNVGRHILGAGDALQGKATGLARRLRRDLPHLVVNAVDQDWRQWCEAAPSQLSSHDLVISTTGEWRAEHALNSMARQSDSMPPIMFCWLEPFAVAGHALSVHPLGGCFGCGVDSLGLFEKAVACFEGQTLTQESAGCEYYQKYGPVALMPIAAMAAEAALDMLLYSAVRSELHTWVGSNRLFDRSQASLTPKWAPVVESGGYNRIYSQHWSRSEECALCK